MSDNRMNHDPDHDHHEKEIEIACDPDDDHYDCYKWIANNPIEMDWEHYAEQTKKAQKELSQLKTDGLPPLLSWDEMMQDLETNGLPPELIEGVLHKGCKGCISGSSKAGKTWTLVNLAISAASGFDWLGLATLRSKVLYLDFELQRSFAQQRFKWVREKMNVDENLVRENLTYWNLRGNREPIQILIAHLQLSGLADAFDLIILDPYYKISAGFDENAADQVAEVMSLVEDFAQATGAAFMFSHHFSKGNKAEVDSIDRASGSGVFARDPDAIITMTKHEEDDCLTLEATLRNCPPLDPKVLEFSKESFPCFEVRDDLDPNELKTIENRRKDQDDSKAIMLAILPSEAGKEIRYGDWKTKAKNHGVSKKKFELRLESLVEDGIVEKRSTPGRGNPSFYSRAEIF